MFQELKNTRIVFKRFLKARETFHSISELPKGARVGIVGAGLSGIELASELRESHRFRNYFI